MQRRRTELALLVFAALIISGLYALSALGKTASLPANIGPFLIQVLALFLIAHLATRRLAPGADGTLLPLAVLLNGIGYVFIARLDEKLAALQANWTAVGIGAYVLTLVIVRRVRDLQRLEWTFGLIGLLLLLMPLVPGIGREINGAKIWVSLGPLNFQPGEFAKIALALFFAAYLVDRRELLAMTTWRVGPLHLPEPRYLGPVLVAWGISLVVMIAERDLGSSLLFFALFVVMLWVATERALYLALGGVMFAIGAYVSWTQFAHVRDRVAIGATRGPIPRARVSRSCRRSSRSRGVASWERDWVSAIPLASPPSNPTSSSRPSARSSACSAARLSSPCTCSWSASACGSPASPSAPSRSCSRRA